MSLSSLVTHRGARQVDREELDRIDAPPGTASWFPIRHSHVLDTAILTLTQAGFGVHAMKHALARDNQRYFGVLDLRSSVATGVNLAVGVRNSTDRSLPMGFLAGNRVFCCDNLAFRSDLMSAVARKHTKNGALRFAEAMGRAVGSLHQFRETERERIRRLQQL